MQKYPVKAQVRKQLTLPKLVDLCRSSFETARMDGEAVVASYGALAELKTWLDGKDLAVDVKMNPLVESTLQQETIRRYNQFLQEATGFSSKERARKLRKSAGTD